VQVFTADETTAKSNVGTNVEYARFLEKGFHGPVEVRGHMRRVKSRDVRGKVEDERGRVRRRVIKAGSTMVRAHTRQVDQNARPFLGPELAAARSRVRTRIAAAWRGE